jgi:protein TonB
VTPVYPAAAQLRRIEGWVELDFTVDSQGAVQDIVVHAASQPGVFERAAIGALAQWRFQPIMRDAHAVAQRARIRIRFALAA